MGHNLLPQILWGELLWVKGWIIMWAIELQCKKKESSKDYCLNIITQLLKCKFQMEIAVTIILLMLSVYTQRNQSIDTTG